MRWARITLVGLALAAPACSGSSGSDSAKELRESKQRVAELEAAATSTSRAAERAEAPAGPVVQTTEAPSVPPTTAAPATAPPTTAAPITTAPAPSLMPDVVCMNLQEAQDFIQAQTDVFLSRSEDATGAGRSQIVDSNWIVVAQRPAAGSPIGEGDAVLSVVKIEEPNDC